jgi:hypothetical protein
MTGAPHSFLFEPDTWTATGHFWEGGQLKRDAHGTTAVRHFDSAWEIDGEMEVLGELTVRFRNLYRVEPPSAQGEAMRWRSQNPALGIIDGVFAVADETILSFFQTADWAHGGSETLTRLAADRYRASGILVSAGEVASIWSMELVRQG